MPRSGATTRLNILNAAQGIILQRGFAGASIDRIITEAGITKGAFFHHFPNKAALAEAVVTRFIETEAALFDDICVRAERLSDDPVQRLLNILGLYADALDQHPEVIEGCIYASVALQRSEYPATISGLTSVSIEQTVDKLRPYYQAALDAAPPRKAVDVDDLVDLFVSAGEGAIILAGVRQDPALPGRQFRNLQAQTALLLGR
ncbi:TetR/AcrR family transcriptional regulator [Thalassospiraceae bacterium LMO-JJ14]|nr:TetR/AcrR family transcriptional regulator [Thalassospiraceae bacterium LMO-JJ14]